MYCPDCRAEYRPGFTVCSDCEVDLVERLSETPDAPADRLDWEDPTLLETMDQFAAGQLCAFLEGHGIPARMVGPSVVNPYDVGGAAGIVQVVVPREFVAVARDLQAQVRHGAVDVPVPEE